MNELSLLRQRLSSLRKEFDESFAVKPEGEVEMATLLRLYVHEQVVAVDAAEIGALHVDQPTMSIPSRSASLRGVAGIRGNLVAVHDLAVLLGFPKPERSRWLLLAKAAPVALSFQAFDGLLLLPTAELPREAGGSSRVIETKQGPIRLVPLSPLLEQLKATHTA